MATTHYIIILEQLLQKLQQKLLKEQLVLKQLKGAFELLQQEQKIYELKVKISSTQTYLQQLQEKAKF